MVVRCCLKRPGLTRQGMFVPVHSLMQQYKRAPGEVCPAGARLCLKEIIRGGSVMKKLFLRKVSAVAAALLIVSGNVPIQPLSQLFEKAAVTAAAEDKTSEYWADKKASALVESEDHETIYISTAEEFALFAYNVNNGVQNDKGLYSERTVVLLDDIDLSGANWTPIGTESAPFAGKFDGSGCTITGLRVIDQNYRGLFGVASDAVFDSVVISDATISGGIFSDGSTTQSELGSSGVLAGRVYGKSMISNCSVSGLVSGKQYPGGLVGKCGEGAGTITILDSTADVEVYCSKMYSGGLIGEIVSRTEISGCRADGYVHGNGIVGGFVGYIYAPATVSGCAARGDVYSAENYYGGFVGRIAHEDAVISDCWSSGSVWGNGGDIGSFVGYGASGTIQNSNVCDYTSGSRPFCGDFGNEMNIQGGVLSISQIEELSKDEDGTPWPEVRRHTYGVKEISTAEEFLAIADDPNGCYVLVNDIDFIGETIEPIGNYTAPFKGEFYGLGHKISNFYVETKERYAGLFGKISGGRVSGLKVEVGYVTGKSNYTGEDAGVGSFAGKIDSKSLIDNCSFIGEVWNVSSCNTGGFVGYTQDSPVILRCCTESYVANESDKDNTGGFVGNHGGGFIKDAYAQSSVDSSAGYGGDSGNNTGGFAGSVSSSARIANSWCYSYVSSDGGHYRGAFVGKASSGLITNSYYKNTENDLKAAGTSSGSDDYSGITCLWDEEMYDRNRFTGFDFDNTWIIMDESPCFQWQTYKVRIEYKDGIRNGTVTADKTTGLLGDELITLTVTPDEGYRLKTLTVIDDDGRELTVTNNQFELSDADVTVIVEFEKLTGGYISGANLSLRGEIGVNLFIRPFPELGDGAYVMVKGPNDTQARKVILDDSIYRSDKQAYLVSAPVYAAQMGEKVEFTLYNSAGEPQQLWNTAKTKSYDTFTYSVKDYISRAKEQKDGDGLPTRLAVLAQKMENYGAWSTTYMKKIGEVDEDAELIAPPVEITDVTEETVEDKQLINNSTVTGLSASLCLVSQTAIRLYYSGDKIEGITAYRDGNELSLNTGYSPEKGKYFVEIPDVAAQYLDDGYEVDFGDKGTVTVNGLSYVYLALIYSNDTDLHNVVKALFEYNRAAEIFFAS